MPPPKQERHPTLILNLAVLLGNLWAAREDERFGELDTRKTIHQLTRSLSQRRFHVPLADLESALAICNLRNEVDDFWHPEDKTFAAFLEEMGLEFDRAYNEVRKR